jgi:hypothetical protein
MKKLSLQSFIIGAFTIALIFGAAQLAAAATRTVTKSANSNDGVCDADCSLREAVAVAQAGDTIVFDHNLVGQTFVLGGTDLTITKHITIDGTLNDPNVVFLSGSSTSRHFWVTPTGELNLKNMILVQGNGSGTNLPGSGGSIGTENGGRLTLDRVALRGNQASSGGALYLFGTALHAITNTSITGNRGSFGSAVLIGGNSDVFMSNTTISHNNQININTGDWGALTSFSDNVVLRNCTITDNQGIRGGGIFAGGDPAGSFDLGNTIVAGNTATGMGQDMFYSGIVSSSGGNLIGNSDTIPAGVFNKTKDVVNVNALLAPLNSNVGGFPIDTHPLQAGSPAIGGGINSLAFNPATSTALANDARGTGFPRITGTSVDKGAFEDQTNGRSLIVTKKPNSNDNVCDLDCSLREAVAAAAADPGVETITFHPSVFGTLDLGGSEIVIENNNLNIVGYPSLSAETLIISGGDASRLFRITNSTVSMNGLTLANGNGVSSLNPGLGGAIFAELNSNLTLDRVIVRNNTADFFGALYLLSGTHRIINSTINNNSATYCIAVANVGATLNMANTTLTANFDTNGGTGAGALCNISAATANVRNSTIAFNRMAAGGTGAGIWSDSTLNLGNTIVSDNIAGTNPDINNASGTVNSLGGNLVEDANGLPFAALNAAGDQTGVNPLLTSLADNGGGVPTIALNPTSPAINTGINANAVDPFDNSVLATDARGSGFMRIVSIVDKGAFETLIPTAAGVSVSGKVFDGEGVAASKAKVYLTDSHGLTRIATTNNFGNFTFADVASGETYVVNVYAKKWQYDPRVVNVSEDITDLNFSPQQ